MKSLIELNSYYYIIKKYKVNAWRKKGIADFKTQSIRKDATGITDFKFCS